MTTITISFTNHTSVERAYGIDVSGSLTPKIQY
jgi:hypothetical protein